MFVKAYETATRFTHPIIIALRFFDQTVESGLGAFVILNSDGWLITAAHNLDVASAFIQHQQEQRVYTEQIEQIHGNQQLKEHQKQTMLKALKPNPKWITNYSILLAGQNIPILESHVYRENDIAFVRIDKANLVGQTVFPKIIDPSSLKPGRSLLKLGYPFVEVRATFDETTNSFKLSPNVLPAPFFPIEGIYTRNLLMGKTLDQTDKLFLETSSAGLKGQSGGPICDSEGTIWAIQSQNVTMPLGFKGRVEEGKRMVEENQFLNVGIGVHPQIIVELLQKHQICFEMAQIY